MAISHFSPDADPAAIRDRLDTDGCAVIDDLAAVELLDALAEEVAPFVAASATGRDTYDGRHTRRTGALIARCPSARRLVADPLVLDVVGRFLDRASTFQIHLTQLITLGPGETAQKPHRDQMAFDNFDFPVDYHVQCNTMWALTDFTVDNGATHLFPGSSRLDDHSGLALAEARAEMRRGSVLLYDGKVLHGGGANRTTEARQGVNITYAVGWVRQEENQYLACPPEIARDLDDDLLRLMGYRQGAFALGYVGDQTDPLAALRGRADKVATVGEYAEGSANYRGFVAELDGD
ncbi:MAG: phytanoyl-CoA dioxygenase family protein [Ilumatobacteraceae bacterium]